MISSSMICIEHYSVQVFDAAGKLQRKYSASDFNKQASGEGLVPDGKVYYLNTPVQDYPVTSAVSSQDENCCDISSRRHDGQQRFGRDCNTGGRRQRSSQGAPMPTLVGRRGLMAEKSPTKGSLVEEGNVNARMIQYTPTPTRVMSVAYVLELRRLIREDAYRSEAVADVIARRLIDAGDI